MNFNAGTHGDNHKNITYVLLEFIVLIKILQLSFFFQKFVVVLEIKDVVNRTMDRSSTTIIFPVVSFLREFEKVVQYCAFIFHKTSTSSKLLNLGY